jgi:hypothetical protein
MQLMWHHQLGYYWLHLSSGLAPILARQSCWADLLLLLLLVVVVLVVLLLLLVLRCHVR